MLHLAAAYVPALIFAVALSALASLPPLHALVLGFAVPAFLLALLPYVWPALGAAILALVALSFRAAVRAWVAHKATVKSEKVFRAGLIIADACRIGAGYVEQAIAPQLRDPSGVLSPAGAAAAKAAAIAKTLEWLTQGGAKEVVLGDLKLTDEQLEQRLGVGVEAEVAALPSAGTDSLERRAAVAKTIQPLPPGSEHKNVIAVAPAS